MKSNNQKLSCKGAFEEFGYLCLRDCLDSRMRQNLERDIEGVFRAFNANFSNIHEEIISLDKADKDKLYKISQVINSLSTLTGMVVQHRDIIARVLDVISPIYTLDAAVLMAPPMDKRLAYGWHREQSYFRETSGKIVSFWSPLFAPSTKDNGAMSLLEKSHKRRDVSAERIKQPSGLTTFKPIGIEAYKDTLNEYHCLFDLNDVVMFDSGVIHRSNQNTSERVRLSVTCHYLMSETDPGRLKDWRAIF